MGAREIAQQLRALATHAEAKYSVPKTHMVTNNR